MPTPNAGESRESYMGRCMPYPDLQKYDEKQRAAICEHLFDRHERQEQAATSIEDGDRFEQTAMNSRKPRVDREAGIIYDAAIMGRKSNHGYEYSIEAQRATAGRYEQMPLGLDHDYDSKPMKIGNVWGTLSNPRVDENGTFGNITYLKSHERTEQILEDAERGTGLFSISAVTRVRHEQNKIVTDFFPVRCDLVVRSATNKTIFNQSGASQMAEEAKPEMSADDHTAAALHAALDACLAEDTEGHEKAKKMAKMIKAMHESKEEEDGGEEKKDEEKSAEHAKETAEEETAKAEEKKEQARLHKEANDRFEQQAATIAKLEKKLAEQEKLTTRHEQALSARADLQQRVEKTLDKATAATDVDLKKFWDPATTV